MFNALLLASIVWMVIFIASAAFDAWYEIYRPSILTSTLLGRILAVVGIAPLILTIGITAIVSIPIMVIIDLFDDPYAEDSALDGVWETLGAVLIWFKEWAPAYVIDGRG